MLHEKFRMLHSNFDTIDGGTSIVVMLSRARIESEAALFNMSSLQLFQRTFHSSASTSTIKDAKPIFFDTTSSSDLQTQSEGQPVRLCTLQLPTHHFPNVPFKKFPAVLQEQIMTTTTKRRESKRLV